jgi:L-lactate dehydrogenase complex protein LldG
MTARDRILGRLRQAQQQKSNSIAMGGDLAAGKRHMLPLPDMTADERLTQFISEAQELGCSVYQVSRNEAIEQIMDLLDGDTSVLSWAEDHLPMGGLHAMLDSLGVSVAPSDAGDVRVGITGISAALAATGSLILESGAGRPRSASLLPDRHIALMTGDQLMTDLEDWQATQQNLGYPAFKQASNTVIVSGPSKTADIGHQLVKGAHGPREVHILILRDDS